MRMAAKSEREEALLSLSITGGLLFGCFGLYYALTSAAGIDEVLAGQLVLLVRWLLSLVRWLLSPNK